MVAYQQFLELSRSGDSEARGRAAHILASAYLAHKGPADEQAALYAALFGFLDDSSVKVRAALAYGLLRAPEAPRAVMLALTRDAPVIARAVAQYSPVLLDVDLVGLARTADLPMLEAIASRATLSVAVTDALLARQKRDLSIRVLERSDARISAERLCLLAQRHGEDADLRGVLLKRADLPAAARYGLVERVRDALMQTRMVKGSIAPERLRSLMRDALDRALTEIGERESAAGGSGYAEELVSSDRVSTRLMLHALVHGHLGFLAECLACLSDMPRAKVETLLQDGQRPALNALFARCGFGVAIRNLLARLVSHARETDLGDDLAGRHYVVTLLTEELIIEFGGDIPPALEDAFAYLNEQNIALARLASRGVMAAFTEEAGEDRPMIGPRRHALPAA